ncbi:Cell Wall Hydrolase [Limimonas halophila]|uniref:Cell Wall Hydrolase n=1 Tax=Limimonas halophila TaxID=1082479 RepID=A0A1G7PP29_9PROT|nr:cell wall hydrolase [Limimonas halophila]SDF87966.1 Cell Wall Hydrolase [Limimonas halophila]
MTIHFDAEDLHAAALTLIGEARGEGRDGMTAVAWVIRNRVADPRWPGRPARVAREPKQFSAWNRRAGNLGNLHRMLQAGFRDELYRSARAIAAGVFADLLADPTGGATHYHTTNITPAWADGDKETARLGSHVFYAL